MLALIISANRDLRSALAAVLRQEGWAPDHMNPQDFEPLDDKPDLLIVAPNQGDDGALSELVRDDSLDAIPMLWVGNDPPPGLGANLVRINRFEVLMKLPNMLQRVQLGVPLAPKVEQAGPVDVVEGQAGFMSPLRGPTGGQTDF